MSTVQQWAWSLCLIILICTVIQYIIPSGAMERSIKLVLGAFVVLGMIVPITNLVQSSDWNFTWDAERFSEANSEYVDQVNHEILEQSKENITVLLVTELEKMGVDYQNIEISMDTNEDNCIVIDKAVITIGVKDAVRIFQIQDTIQTSLGIQTEVVVNGG